MPKRASAYYRPESLEETVKLLARPGTFPLAGGTKLLAGDVHGAVVDLQALGLNRVTWEDDHLHIGAAARLTDLTGALAANGQEGSPAALLQKAIHQAGPNTYRNAATLGGSIASRLPDSELLAALLVLAAELTLYAPAVAAMSLVDYLETSARPNGLITRITLPWTEGRGGSERVARTPADYPIVSITLWQPAASAPRLAATGIAERPLRLTKAETILANGVTETAIESAAAAAKAAACHPGDFRGDAAYRAEMAAVLTKRVCESASLRVCE